MVKNIPNQNIESKKYLKLAEKFLVNFKSILSVAEPEENTQDEYDLFDLFQTIFMLLKNISPTENVDNAKATFVKLQKVLIEITNNKFIIEKSEYLFNLHAKPILTTMVNSIFLLAEQHLQYCYKLKFSQKNTEEIYSGIYLVFFGMSLHLPYIITNHFEQIKLTESETWSMKKKIIEKLNNNLSHDHLFLKNLSLDKIKNSCLFFDINAYIAKTAELLSITQEDSTKLSLLKNTFCMLKTYLEIGKNFTFIIEEQKKLYFLYQEFDALIKTKDKISAKDFLQEKTLCF